MLLLKTLEHQQVAPLDGKTLIPSCQGIPIAKDLSSEKQCRVDKFFGIKYASVPARFRTARPVDFEKSVSTVKGRKYGPRCPQPIDYPREQRHHLYNGIEASSATPVDEFDCLTLNIYKPDQALQSNGSLPVIAWIHGGGWTVGDGNSEYDGSFLVQHSIASGNPCIFVGINYRLGFYGFLASQELQAEEADIQRWNNQGLHDQRLALQWIQCNISKFGGDPARVTLAGESAGAWCVMAHSQAHVCLFQRAIIMSCPKVTITKFADAQSTFDELVQRAGCKSDATAEEKLRALRSMTDSEMESALDGRYIRPIAESQLFGCELGGFDLPSATNSPLSFPSWIEGIMVGSTRDEAALWISNNDQDLLKDESYIDRVLEAIRKTVPDSCLAEEIIGAYDLSSTQTRSDQSRIITAVQRLTSDGVFRTIPHIIASNVSHTPTLMYSFRQTDEHEKSPFRGASYHSLDNVYFCRLPSVTVPGLGATVRTKATVDMLNAATLTFASGQMPWPKYNETRRDQKEVFVFDGQESRLERTNEELVKKMTQFLNTEERETMFAAAGRIPLGLAKKF